MGKQDDARIAKLVRQNAAKVRKPTGEDPSPRYDDTLRIRRTDDTVDAQRMFKEMKRREF